MSIYKIFVSYEAIIKIILLLSILIVSVLIFFNNGYFKLINIPEAKNISQINIPEAKNIPQINIPEAKNISQINIPEAKNIPQINIPEAKNIPQINIPEAKNISQINIPEAKNIPDSVSMIIAKIISDKNFNSTQISYNTYEDKTWESYALGCPRSGEFYALSIVKGLKISIDINGEENIIHTDQNLNYVNCTEIIKKNSNANYNFYKQYNLENTSKITLVLNSSEKILITLEDKEKITKLTKSLDKDINIMKVDYCNSRYTLIFSSESENIKFRVACEENLNYVEAEESLETTNLFVKILEDLLSNLEFPGMPSNE